MVRPGTGSGKRFLSYVRSCQFSERLSRTVRGAVSSLPSDAKQALSENMGLQVSALGQVKHHPKDYLDVTLKCFRKCESELSGGHFTEVYLELAAEYLHLGFEATALQLANEVLNKSGELLSSTVRRAHNIAAASSYRTFDFKSSCVHLIKGYHIARELNDPLGRYAVLANVVAMLKSSGLLEEAKCLASYLLATAVEQEIPDILKYQLSINGALLCAQTGDDISFRQFHKEAAKYHSLVPHIHDDWRSMYDSHELHLLILDRDELTARKYLLNAWSERSCDDLRVLTYLSCAEGELNLVFGTRVELARSRRRLRRLLICDGLGEQCKEHILRTLICLYENDGKRGRTVAFVFARLLQEHFVGTKHRLYFSNAHTAFPADPNAGMPNFRGNVLGFWETNFDETRYVAGLERRVCGTKSSSQWSSISDELRVREYSESMRALRSSDYFIAESCAVAAEIATGRTGLHCFQVGRLAGVIARSAGWSTQSSEELELACRLHDLGILLLDDESIRASSTYRDEGSAYHREHTLAGQRILLTSSDVVLRLAAGIAASHHEWWNGCGYPNGYARNEIPIAGRICALANYFVQALDEHDGPRWSVGQAVQQVISMAGVQLDPQLIEPFLSAIGTISFREDVIYRILKLDMGCSSRTYGDAVRRVGVC